MTFLFNIFIFPIEIFLGICLSELYNLTGNYGISLILLSLIINIILIPVYRLADKWQAVEKNIQDRMQREIASIKKYYTTGEKKYYQIKAVYRRYGYNPLYSLRVSLGFLIQIPFFFAAYHFLSNYQNLYEVSFLFIENLGAPDQFLYGLNMLPVVMTLINIASVIIYSKNMTNPQKVQLHFMSIIFLIILYNMPSGLIIYWTTNNVFSLIKNTVKFIKTQSRPAFKSMFTIKSLPDLLDKLILSQYSRYVIYAILFIVTSLLTYHLLDEYKNYGLGRFSIKASIVLLFIAIMIIAIGIAKSRAKSFHGFTLIYFIILMTTSAGAISVGRLLEVIGVTQKTTDFMLFFLPASVLILLYKYFKLLRDEYGVNILKPSLSVIKFDKRGFYLTLILFNTIFFIWGPSLTVYSAAPDEFNISFIHILLWQPLLFLVSFVVFLTFYIAVPQRLKHFLTFVLQYLSVTAIIYLVFNRRDIGMMDHFVLNHEDYLDMQPHEMFLEVLLLYSILLCLYLTLRYASGLMNRVMSFSIIIILLSTVYFSGKIFQNRNNNNKSISSDAYELSLSKDKSNVLIFILDGFSGGAVNQLKDSVPELFNGFDGFTWYTNILTTGVGTWGAIATLYGGHKYSIEEINMISLNTLREDFSEAYNLYGLEFHRHGYKTNYVNSAILGCDYINDNSECYSTNNSEDSFKYAKSNPETPMYSIPLLIPAVTIFKAIPHMFQSFVYDHGTWHGIIEKKVLTDTDRKKEHWTFLQSLKDRVKVKIEPSFNIIYLSLPHAANVMSSECEYLDNYDGKYVDDAFCALRAVNKLTERMKELGVFDNTMIVLVSDHGWWTENKMFNEDVFSSIVPPAYENRLSPGFINPLLMVKDINASGNLDISEVFLSNADVPSIVCTVIGSCEGIPDDYRKFKGTRVLTVNLYKPDNEVELLSNIGYGHVISRYEVTDNIFDASNWKKVF